MGRLLAEVGWLRLLLLGALAVVAMGKVLELLLARPTLQWAWPVAGALVCWSGHRQRADLVFLQTASPEFRQWLSVEYVLWLLPFWGMLLGLGHFAAALAMVGATALVPYVPLWQPATAVRQRRSVFRSEAFEWVSGFRQTGAWGLWSAGLTGALWQHTTVVPAVVLGGWSLFITACYATPEPLPMVTIYGRGAARFRWRKLGLAVGLYLLTAAPFFALVVAGSAGWAGGVGLLVWGILVILMGVMAKYAFYPQPTLVRLTQGGVVLVAVLPLLNAAYAPISVAVFLGLIWKSHQQIKIYWHA
ncbi:hypothetical protein [Hymenobacter elongatus]|uniref:hypothetical protein n=1 Tax=Hymenobacter elongatus TaxID=877208 RepID=UPI001AEBEBC1|nr:hypothetical protein [Hymenobacter elongatus]